MTKSYIHGTQGEEQQRLSDLNKITNDSFIKYLGIEAGQKVCDFGCGLGNLMKDIAKLHPDVEITGLEKSKDQYLKAKENIGDNRKVTLKNQDILKNDLPDNYFDVTYCRYVLEHVDDPALAVKEMLRVTKNGGRIVSQENDLHNVIYFPEIPGHGELMKQFCALQTQMKGDPFVGRKLFSIYNGGGAKQVQLSYEPEIYTEENPAAYRAWMNNSLNIFLGAKEELLQRKLVDRDVHDAVCNELRARIQQPLGVALFHWNRVCAQK